MYVLWFVKYLDERHQSPPRTREDVKKLDLFGYHASPSLREAFQALRRLIGHGSYSRNYVYVFVGMKWHSLDDFDDDKKPIEKRFVLAEDIACLRDLGLKSWFRRAQ